LHDAANALNQEAISGRARFVATDGIDLHVLDLLAKYFQNDAVEPLISIPLFIDVKSQLNLMVQRGQLDLVSTERFMGEAFTLAVRFGLSVSDALPVVLAEERGLPLLIADEALRDRLRAVERGRDLLQVVWLPDR
jgi:predicted nucleic acid-binding protein